VVQDGEVPDWKLDEATELWLQTRKELEAHPNPAAEHRLMLLNTLLANRFGPHEPLRARAFRQASLEVVTLSRHLQELRCDLARAAARESRFQEAEAWLSPCTSTSDDIQMDSAYRYAASFVASRKKDFQQVLDLLGRAPGEVPLAQAYTSVCTLLRADALERTGQKQLAQKALESALTRSDAESIRSLMQKYGEEYHWCETSYPRALEAAETRAATRAGSQVAGGFGGLLLAIGILHLIPALGLLVWLLFSGTLLYLIPGGVLLAVGGALALWGIRDIKKQRHVSWVRRHGRRAKGTIVSLSRTGLSVNDVPQMKVVVRVEGEDHEPYDAETKLLVEPQEQAQFKVGTRLSLRVNPNNPDEVVLETS